MMKKSIFAGKRVLLRADLNVSFEHGKIVDDYRLQALIPTLNEIQEAGGKIILLTHIGRPHATEPELSTKQLVPWFRDHGYQIKFEANLENARKESYRNPKEIMLLENLRFFPGEQDGDSVLAQQLAQLGDVYVNDAFGVLHRNDTSITLLPQEFAPENRTIGLLIQKELLALKKLKNNPDHPFIIILGGAKISDKIPLLQAFIGIADTILLCPAIVFTFLKALGKPVGTSLVDEDLLQTTRTIMDQAKKQGTTLLFPVDYQIADKTFGGPLSILDSTDLPKNAFGVSIGPKTQALFASEIKKAKTVFLNGALGDPTRPQTLHGKHALLVAMAQSNAFTVVGGGDSVAVARAFNLADQLSLCSTGGGAALAYLAGKKLPGLAFFDV